MLKILIFLLLLLPLTFGFSSREVSGSCNCPSVSNVQKTGQTSTSISFSWNGPQGATGYNVWYDSQTDQNSSAYYYSTSASYEFTNLTPGNYTFYFEVICGEVSSGWVGVEDVVQ